MGEGRDKIHDPGIERRGGGKAEEPQWPWADVQHARLKAPSRESSWAGGRIWITGEQPQAVRSER